MKVFYSLFFTALILFSSCSREITLADTPSIKVRTAKVQARKITPEIRTFGSLAFAHKVDLTAQVEGTLLSSIPDEGTRIIKSQLLTKLENLPLDIQKKQAQKEIETAEAGLQLSKAKYWEARIQFETRRLELEKTEKNIRQKRLELEEAEKNLLGKEALYELEGISSQELSALKLKVSACRTELQSMENDLSSQQIGLREKDIQAFGLAVPQNDEEKEKIFEQINTTIPEAELKAAFVNVSKAQNALSSLELIEKQLQIYSPIEGIIAARYADKGEHVAQGTKLATVFTENDIDAVVQVREEDGLKLSTGMKAQVWIEALSGDFFAGTLAVVSPLVDPNSGHITVKIRLSSPEPRFKPGLFARVTIPFGSEQKILTIPLTAVAEKTNENGKVFIVINRCLVEKKIRLGTEENGYFTILEGLKENDVVVDAPTTLLKEGDRVEISG